MKTPEEIKKGLECCSQSLPYPCSGCPYERDEQQENAWRCDLDADARAYIQQLEAQKQPETLVHCGECTRYMPEPMGDVMMCYGFANGHWTAPDDFCSRGVRRK